MKNMANKSVNFSIPKDHSVALGLRRITLQKVGIAVDTVSAIKRKMRPVAERKSGSLASALTRPLRATELDRCFSSQTCVGQAVDGWVRRKTLGQDHDLLSFGRKAMEAAPPAASARSVLGRDLALRQWKK
jgi:hypothetical protein